MENINETIWRDIFLKLYQSQEPDPIPMWAQFLKTKLSIDDITSCFEGDAIGVFTDARDKLEKFSEETTAIDEFIKRMKKDETIFDKKVWKHVVFTIRDRESRPLDLTKTIPVIVCGQERNMNMSDLEQKFLEDFPDLLVSQTCVPEYLDKGDLEHITSAALKQKLREMYEDLVETKLKQKDQTRMKAKEIENFKRSVEKEALAVLKKTWEANKLQKQQADEAEAIVQHALYKALQKHGIVATVLRGVRTYQEVAKALLPLGIKCSKFGNLVKLRSDATPETEHDVAVLWIISTGVYITFVQVHILLRLFLIFLSIVSRSRQMNIKSHMNRMKLTKP